MVFAAPADTELAAAQRRAQLLRPALSRVVAVFNGKGGAGKSSVAVNVAGLLAMAGAATGGGRVLIVDCDPGTVLRTNLGYSASDADDRGAGLVQAMTSPAAPVVLADVRPHLDVICGGEQLRRVPFAKSAEASLGRPQHARLMLAEAIARVAPGYDWVFLDCPPISADDICDMALIAARAVLVPVGFDMGSAVGLEDVAKAFGRATQLNTTLDLLGLVMFGFDYTGDGPERGMRRRARERFTAWLRAAGSGAPVFDTVIRHTKSVAEAERARGQLAAEIQSVAGPKWWEIRSGAAAGQTVPSAQAATLAGEYEALTREALTRFLALDGAAQEVTA